MPVVEVGARFVMPCRFDDDIVVESEVSEWGRSSFTVRHRILKAGELAVDGFEKRVWVAPHPERAGDIKAQAVPAEIIASLSDPTGATTIAFDGEHMSWRKSRSWTKPRGCDSKGPIRMTMPLRVD